MTSFQWMIYIYSSCFGASNFIGTLCIFMTVEVYIHEMPPTEPHYACPVT